MHVDLSTKHLRLKSFKGGRDGLTFRLRFMLLVWLSFEFKLRALALRSSSQTDNADLQPSATSTNVRAVLERPLSRKRCSAAAHMTLCRVRVLCRSMSERAVRAQLVLWHDVNSIYGSEQNSVLEFLLFAEFCGARRLATSLFALLFRW